MRNTNDYVIFINNIIHNLNAVQNILNNPLNIPSHRAEQLIIEIRFNVDQLDNRVKEKLPLSSTDYEPTP